MFKIDVYTIAFLETSKDLTVHTIHTSIYVICVTCNPPEMSAILGHYCRNGEKVLSRWIPGLSVSLRATSLEYFDRTFLIVPSRLKIEMPDDPVCNLSVRQVKVYV